MSVLLSTALGLAGAIGATGPQQAAREAQPTNRAPGTPGVPQDPTVVYTEDFENAPADKPVRLTGYTGATGETYTAHANWLTGCNGWVLDNTATSSGYAPGIADCGNSANFWDQSRDLAAVLGRYNGTATPNQNQAVTAFTYNSPGANRVEFETVQPIPLPRTNRFLAFSVNSAATNCSVSAPQLNFFLVDGATAVPASAKPLNPCTDPAAKSYTVDGKAYKAVGRASDAPVLFAGSALGIRMTNANGSGTGNDAAFDDIKVLDVTPQVDKAFTPAVAPAGGTSTLVFTVTNTSDLAAKKGWSFTDTLPAGLTVAGPAPAATTCTNGKVSSDNGLGSVALSGDLTAGQSSCTLAVQVTAAAGTYRNCAENIGDVVGVDLPGCAEVRFVTPHYTIAKTSDPADGGAVLPGQRVEYRVLVTNPGEVPVDAKIDDDLTAVLDDAVYNNDAAATTGTPAFTSPHLTWAQTLAPGASATVSYSVTVNDPDTGDRQLKNAVTGTGQSNCPTGTEAGCTTGQGSPHLTVEKTATPGSTHPGGRVDYTLTVTNDGTGPYAGATLSDDLTGVLDDAAYNGDLTADSGTATYTAPKVDWTGDVAAGQTVTLRYSVTVHAPDTGDKQLKNAVTGPAGSNCPSDSDSCSTDTPVATLLIAKLADKASARPGDTVGYTVTVTNDGAAPYPGARVTDDLTGVLDDAAYNGDLTADSGTAAYTAPKVDWTGDVAPGQTVTIRYSVKVNTPDTGDKQLTNAAVGPDGSDCAACTTDTPVADVLIVKKADKASAKPGDTVGYTVTVTNGTTVPYPGATASDDLTGVLDDATYNGDLTADSGTATYTAPKVDWTGDVAPGQTVTIRYSVKVNTPDTGDKHLVNAVTGPPGSNCPADTANCGTDTPVASLAIAKKADTASTKPGGKVGYTVTVTNTGTATYTGATASDDLTQVLDDATYNGDLTADSGTATYTAPKVDWTGDLAPGQTVTIRYSVKVNTPDTGDKHLVNAVTGPPGSNCPADTANCGTDTPVASLAIAKQADTASAKPGGKVGYTVTVTNTGTATYTGATANDDLTQVLDDAAYNGDLTADSGTATYTAPKVDWTGDLAPGQTATIRYSVTVNTPDTGDKHLVNAVTGPGGSDCTTCTTDTPVATLVIVKQADKTRPRPGDTVGYTVTVANDGTAAYPGATMTDDLTRVLDDATYNGDLTADSGTATYTAPAVEWTGDVA
ncbi:hypothetical protein ACFV6F_26870, partial [Kitasatospora phosalacinea]